MKKLYRKGSVHPSPPPTSDPLAFLPLAILTLAAALSPEDREVLAYLISCGNSSSKTRTKSTAAKTRGGGRDHPPSFGCSCFRCYTSYWARWDSSPNRQLIHEIIDAFEDDLVQTQVGKEEKKERRRKGSKTGVIQRKAETGISELRTELTESGRGEETSGGGDVLDAEEREDAVCCEKGSVSRFVSFIGERLWNVWT